MPSLSPRALPRKSLGCRAVINHRGLHPYGDVHGQLPVQLEQQQRGLTPTLTFTLTNGLPLGLEVRNHGETCYVNLQGPQKSRANTRHIMALQCGPTGRLQDSILMATWFSKCLWPFMSYGEYDYRFMSIVNSADVGYKGATLSERGIRISLLRHPSTACVSMIRLWRRMFSRQKPT